jgi:hypothetical protein
VTTTAVVADELGPLARLAGSWRGEGSGRWGDARFGYVEEIELVHAGKPHLVYAQRTRASDDGRPLHGERGFWRVAGGAVELVIAQGIGIAEISVGRWDGDTLRTHSSAVLLSPSAKPVTSVVRSYEIRGDLLLCTLAMSTDGGGVLPHLEARLQRVG